MPASPLARPQRDISAILFADVCGYARLMDRNEERTYERVSRSIRLMKSLIGDYGGRVMNVAGDGALALFESAAAALRFAIAIQQELCKDVVWNPDDEPVVFRIGINLGEVLIDEDANVHGRSVNVAARIQALARPGGICISEAVKQAAPDVPDLVLHSLGRQNLTSIAEPVEVFAVAVGTVSPALVELPSHSPAVLPLADASVAVLPLTNLSGDPRDDHLCDGITGDVITNLSRFRDLLVIARHSAFLFKDTHVPAKVIGDQLGVRYLMCGGLQRQGSRVRINVELSEIETGKVIWSDLLKGDLGDVFAFQDDVTDVVAARLALQIDAAERHRVLSTAPPDLRAYGLVLRGQELSIQLRQQENLHARRLFEQAAEVDPAYGRPYAGLSRTFNTEWQYAWTDAPQACLDTAVKLALQAIERDDLDARGYAQLGYAYLFRKQPDASLAAYAQAIQLNPNDADILADTARSTRSAGDTPRTMELIQRAMRLNPFYPDSYLWVLGDAYFDLAEYEQVIQTLHRMRDKSEGHRLLAASHALLGHMDEAKYHAEQVIAVHPNFSIEHWRNIPPDKNPEPLKRFFEGLRLAGLR
jgi:TolB-like protein/class 3 adenylate cyclase